MPTSPSPRTSTVNRLKLRLTMAFCLTAFLLSPAGASAQETAVPADGAGAADKAPQAPAPISATDLAAIQAAKGKSIVIHGKVTAVESTKSGGHKKLLLEGAKVFVFIEKKSLASGTQWELEQWVGKEIFARGVADTYYKSWEVTVRLPGHLAESLEALAPEDATGAAAKPAAPAAPPVKMVSASLTQLRLVAKGSKEAKVVELAVERFDAAWEKASSSTSAPVKIASTSTKLRELALQAAQTVQQRHPDKWPKGWVLGVKSSASAAAPGTFATALLLESTLQGVALPAGLHVAGELMPSGALTAGHNEFFRASALRFAPDSVLLASPSALDTLTDFAVAGDWTAVAAVPVFSAAHLDDALTICRGLAEKQWESALKTLAALQPVLAQKGVAALRSPEAKSRLQAMEKACPSLLNLRVLSAAAQGRLPVRFSANGSAQRLHALFKRVVAEAASGSGGSQELRKRLKNHSDALKALTQSTDPKWKECVEKLEELIDAIKESARFDEKDSSARAKSARTALEKAQADARESAVSLATEAGE